MFCKLRKCVYDIAIKKAQSPLRHIQEIAKQATVQRRLKRLRHKPQEFYGCFGNFFYFWHTWRAYLPKERSNKKGGQAGTPKCSLIDNVVSVAVFQNKETHRTFWLKPFARNKEPGHRRNWYRELRRIMNSCRINSINNNVMKLICKLNHNVTPIVTLFYFWQTLRFLIATFGCAAYHLVTQFPHFVDRYSLCDIRRGHQVPCCKQNQNQ